MDSRAPGLWARRVALGASAWSGGMEMRRGTAVVVEMRQPEDAVSEAERPRGAGDVPGEGRRQASLSGAAPEGMARGEAQGVNAPGEGARSIAARRAVGDEAAERIGAAVGGDSAWPAEGGTRMQVGVQAVERTREAVDLRGLVETAEERRARVEACR